MKIPFTEKRSPSTSPCVRCSYQGYNEVDGGRFSRLEGTMGVYLRKGWKRRPRWIVQWCNSEGERQYVTVYDEDEAHQLHETMVREAQRRKRKELSTFVDVGKDYINVTRPFVKPQTANLYERVLNQHVYPELGERLIVSLTRSDIKTFLASKLEGGLKAKSVMTIQCAIKGVFDTAIDSEIVANNPAAGLQRFIRRGSNILEGPIKAMTSVQLDRFLDVAEQTEPKFYPIFLTLARTGMRIGEAITLQWDDLDFEERTIRVARSMTIACVIDTPKNGRERQVDMSSQLSEILTRHRTKRLEEKLSRGWQELPPWLFLGGTMRPIARSRVSVAMKRVLERAKLPMHFSPHSLRHTFACAHLTNGKAIAYIQRQLGHASIQMTVDVYGKWLPLSDLEAADALDRM